MIYSARVEKIMPVELKKKYSIVYEMSLDDMCHSN